MFDLTSVFGDSGFWFSYKKEAWSNFRRSGYPRLSKNPYPGADPSVKATPDGFIHRLTYPVEEYTNNTKNIELSASNIGGDNLGSCVFRDIGVTRNFIP